MKWDSIIALKKDLHQPLSRMLGLLQIPKRGTYMLIWILEIT